MVRRKCRAVNKSFARFVGWKNASGLMLMEWERRMRRVARREVAEVALVVDHRLERRRMHLLGWEVQVRLVETVLV
jgi:hypothetical protein